MTREEAIQCIKHELLITVNRKDLTGQAIGEALDMAIEALQREDRFLKSIDTNEPLYTEVVRCKDCRHRDLFSCPLADNDFQKDEDFCSWGERKEE